MADESFAAIEGSPVLNKKFTKGHPTAGWTRGGFSEPSIFITCWGQNILFRNQGDGTFKDVTRDAGLLWRPPAVLHWYYFQ